MREKELRVALVCYGGISLAVYMHGVTKEIWRLARASRDRHAGPARNDAGQEVYAELLDLVSERGEADLRILVDILAGASAGGINAIFLAHAISTGLSLDPLTQLWLESADIDRLLDPDVHPVSRIAKSAAVPLAWALSSRANAVEDDVEPEHRNEVREKLGHFVRARWFAPPFGGAILTGMLIDAFDAMEQGPREAPLLPPRQPLDLFVTVTDFHGYAESVRLHSPPEVVEREHRLTIAFRDSGGSDRRVGSSPALTFAARATASFPGAFPPFSVGELDKVLEDRDRSWSDRNMFLEQALPGHSRNGVAESAVLIDGSVLANAPFGPAIAALSERPARREVDRRFIYIDPKPGVHSVRLTGNGRGGHPPGFLATIFGAMSDIPREQPIRDNLEAIEAYSGRVRRLRRIVRSMQPEVEATIERTLGSTFFLASPTVKRLAAWRARANEQAARSAGYAYAAYAHLKISAVVEDVAEAIYRLSGGGGRRRRDAVRTAIWDHVRTDLMMNGQAVSGSGASEKVILFLRDFDMHFRSRRLRFVARRLPELVETRTLAEPIADLLDSSLGLYLKRDPETIDPETKDRLSNAISSPSGALAALAGLWGLKRLDEETDERLTALLSEMPKAERRRLILNYLGYPFYDVATLPLLQGEGLDEFDPIKVDRISPDDAKSIRQGGAAETLKGIQLYSFGAFFCRAYRENDYLWGRLHGAERMIDITLSTLPAEKMPEEADVQRLKRRAFRAILDEERGRLLAIPALFETLDREIGEPG